MCTHKHTPIHTEKTRVSRTEAQTEGKQRTQIIHDNLLSMGQPCQRLTNKEQYVSKLSDMNEQNGE